VTAITRNPKTDIRALWGSCIEPVQFDKNKRNEIQDNLENASIRISLFVSLRWEKPPKCTHLQACVNSADYMRSHCSSNGDFWRPIQKLVRRTSDPFSRRLGRWAWILNRNSRVNSKVCSCVSEIWKEEQPGGCADVQRQIPFGFKNSLRCQLNFFRIERTIERIQARSKCSEVNGSHCQLGTNKIHLGWYILFQLLCVNLQRFNFLKCVWCERWVGFRTFLV